MFHSLARSFGLTSKGEGSCRNSGRADDSDDGFTARGSPEPSILHQCLAGREASKCRDVHGQQIVYSAKAFSLWVLIACVFFLLGAFLGLRGPSSASSGRRRTVAPPGQPAVSSLNSGKQSSGERNLTFCFSLMIPRTLEHTLLEYQNTQRSSIFSCMASASLATSLSRWASVSLQRQPFSD